MKPQDQLAAGIAFGVELETYIPSGAGITVGAYHRGDPVRSGPSFEGQFWRADRDASIRAAAGCRPCEFVSPILQGEAGLACLRQFVRFAKQTVGAGVNLSCGCHITVGIQSVIGSADVRATASAPR
jgi:hypothetical protein